MPRGRAWTEPHRDRWRVRAIVDDSRRTVGSYADEATANVYRDAWNAELDAGGMESPQEHRTIASVGAAWLVKRELFGSQDREKVRSIAGELSVWRRHVVTSELAEMDLGSIRSRDVEDYALWLRGRNAVSTITFGSGTSARRVEDRATGRTISRAMQREALRLVRQCLDEAVRQGFISANPADLVRIARGTRAPRDVAEDWLRADEIERLLSCEVIPLRLRTAYATAIGLALRLADLKAIKIGDVHLDAEIPGPHVRVWVSKSERFHSVPIAAWLAPWLRIHIAALPPDARYLFQSDDGAPYRKNYQFAWAAKRDNRAGTPRRAPSALERAGVRRKIRFHDLRGTTATHLALGTWGRRWSLHEIQSMLAHSDQRVTERYVRRAVDTLANAMRETHGGPGAAPVAKPNNGRVIPIRRR